MNLNRLFSDFLKVMNPRRARAIVAPKSKHRGSNAKPRDWRAHRKVMHRMAKESRRRNRV